MLLSKGPLRPLGFDLAQHRQTLRPSVDGHFGGGALLLRIKPTSTPRPPRHQMEMGTKYE